MRLRAAGKRCLYATNNSSRTQSDFGARLRNIGVELDDSDVMTSSSATALYLSGELRPGFSAYVIGGEGIINALRAIGAEVTTGDNADASAADCVVVGIDREFTYAKLRNAHRLIDNGARFIATNRDATFPTENGLTPGAGSLVAAVMTATGVTPTTIGKPEPLMLQLCLRALGLPGPQVVMIGDRLDTDIACAHRAGMPAFLVETGVTTRAAAEAAQGEERPDATFADLPALCDAILAVENSAP